MNDDSDDDGEMVRPCFSMNPSNSSTISEPAPLVTAPKPVVDTFQPTPPLKFTKRLPNTGFIIYETLAQNSQQGITILQVSAAKQGAIVKCDVEVCKSEPTTLECVVRINGTVYATAPIAGGKKEAKQQAFDRALERARKIHYTIKVSEI